mgnify:CR=1 FL=1
MAQLEEEVAEAERVLKGIHNQFLRYLDGIAGFDSSLTIFNLAPATLRIYDTARVINATGASRSFETKKFL